MANLSNIITPTNVLTASSTNTLSNKTISGASNTITNVPLTSAVTGTLPVANGGTGAASLTANNVLLGNGTSAVQVVAPGTNGNVLTSNGTTWTSAAAPAAGFTLGTTVSPSGTNVVDITGIPSTARVIFLDFQELQANPAPNYIDIRLGTSSGFVTTGYKDSDVRLTSGGVAYNTGNISFMIYRPTNGATSGPLILSLMNSSTNTWVYSYNLGVIFQSVNSGGGSVPLPGTLTQLRIATNINGSGANFASGSINISYI